MSDATLSISSRGSWVVDRGDKLEWFDNLCEKVKRVRGFGDFYSYMLLAQGCVDLALEPDLELYDIAALIPIVEGAGGKITDLNGKSWNTSAGIKSTIATNDKINVI